MYSSNDRKKIRGIHCLLEKLGKYFEQYCVYYVMERIDFMAIAVKGDYQMALEEQKTEVRNLVLAGLEQIKEGKTKDFNSVCDKLEKKYRNETI